MKAAPAHHDPGQGPSLDDILFRSILDRTDRWVCTMENQS
jgi:hypothetical protein